MLRREGGSADCRDHEGTAANTYPSFLIPPPASRLGTNHVPIKRPFLAAPHLSSPHTEPRRHS